MDTENGPTRLADADALETFVDEHDLALVEFFTEGCPKCAAMEPVLGNVARASGVAVGLLNPRDDPALFERFEVRSVPTLVVFVDGEAVATRASGFQGTEAVLAFVEASAPGTVETA
ncbi:thioredoxin family protein [Natronomonas marina]|jgi:thioredoxin 1|uniref:thioredoxin family protein n=1 Tax=Natronomonas marina TaxID=2961939 RepID=UPI0020C99EBB|nr:thioredoxin family protein [Natronomonas marina]